MEAYVLSDNDVIKNSAVPTGGTNSTDLISFVYIVEDVQTFRVSDDDLKICFDRPYKLKIFIKSYRCDFDDTFSVVN